MALREVANWRRAGGSPEVLRGGLGVMDRPEESIGRNHVNAEYVWLEIQFGPEGEKWERSEQSLIEEEGLLYDILKVEFSGSTGGYKKGDVAYFYFDITEFYRATLEGMFKE